MKLLTFEFVLGPQANLYKLFTADRRGGGDHSEDSPAVSHEGTGAVCTELLFGGHRPLKGLQLAPSRSCVTRTSWVLPSLIRDVAGSYPHPPPPPPS